MKKLLLGLGSLAMIASPVAAVISCGSSPMPTTPSVATFTFDKDSVKQQLYNFLIVNKGKDVIVNLNGKTYSFKSTGLFDPQLESKVDAYAADIDKVNKEKSAKLAAEQKAAEAKDLAAKKEIATEAVKKVLKSEVISKIKSLDAYTSSSDVKDYNIKTDFVLTEGGVDFKIKISNITKDENGGLITFDASISNDLLDAPKVITSIKLTGFKVNLDTEGKIQNIQQELDDDPTEALSGATQTSSEIQEKQIKSHIQEIVSNDYSIVPTIANITRTSGEVSFDVTYKASADDGTEYTATKKVTLTGLVTDLAKANEIQAKANSLKADVANNLYSSMGSQDSRYKGRTWISETDPIVGGGKTELTSDLMLKMGFDWFYDVNYRKLVSGASTCKFEIDPKTMKVKFYITYNGVDATTAPTETVVYSQQMRNYDLMGQTHTSFRIPDHVQTKELPTNFKLPIGITEIKSRTLYGYKIPATFKIPETVTKVDSDAFAFAELADGFKFPDTVTEFDEGAFERATIPGTFWLPANIDTIHEYLFRGAKIGDGFTLPDTIKNIEKNAFYEAKIGKDFTMPKDLEKLGDEAFEMAHIGDGFVLPEHIKSVSLDASPYSNSSAFSDAILPSNIDISKIVIDSISTTVSHPDKQDKLDAMFKAVKTSDHKIPNYYSYLDKNVLGLGSSDVFPFDKLTIPSTVRTIGDSLFYDEVLPDGFTLPDSITKIERKAFYRSKIPAGFKLPSHLVSIGVDAFNAYGSAPTTTKMPDGFIIPDSVTSIGEGAFAGRTFATGFTIGSGVTTLNGGAFFKSTFADDFILPDTVTKLFDDPFKDATLPTGYRATSNPTDAMSAEKHESLLYAFGEISSI